MSVVVALTILDACDGDSEHHGPNAPPVSLDSFVDGQWALTVDRVWDGASGNATFPSDPLSEEDYQPTANGPAYAVVVSDHGHTVSVGATPFVGSQTAASAERVEFALAQGTFAGGRFVVWPSVETLEAELTLYGSGRPIVQSERGKLVPAP